jgi:thiol-disulfide isomerase/thioredoxin
MRIVFVILYLALTGAGLALAEPPNVAPDWSLASTAGEIVRLSEEVRQQPVVLVFWASWCPYCKALMPHLQSMRLEYGDKIKVLAINFDDDGDPVAYMRDGGYDFTVLPDGDAVAAQYQIYGTPGVLIVDQDQRIRFDLRALPVMNPPSTDEQANHKRVAAYRAPYWAAAIRMNIDSILDEARN